MWLAWEEKRNDYRVLARKREGNQVTWKPRCAWKDNNQMDLKEIGWSTVG
jgi:hypothetical protein